MRVFRRALMGAEQPPLGQRRNLVYGGKQLAGLLSAGSSRPLAAPVVDVAELLQSAIALPAVGYDRRARFDVIRYEPVQRGPRCIRDRCDPTPAHPFRLPDFDRYAGQYLLTLGPAAAQPWLLTADVSLIYFYQPA